MAGRRRRGNALAAGIAPLSQAVSLDIQRQFNAESEGRKFRQRLVELGITGEIPGVEANPATLQGLVTGQGFQGPLLRPSDPQATVERFRSQLGGLLEGDEGELTIKRTIPGLGEVTFKRGAKTAPKLTEGEATRLQLGTQPGQPFPQLAQPEQIGTRTILVGGMPSSLGGQRMLQGLITAGQTESPAASVRSLPAPTNRLTDFARTASSLLLPFGRGGGPSPRAVTLPTSRSFAPSPTISQVDSATQSVLEDLQIGRATPQEFLAQEAELQAAGVDTEIIRRLLGL